MRKSVKVAVGAAILWIAGVAEADVSLNSVRVGAEDVLALGKFYESAFGLKETNRLNLQGGRVELFMNFGATAEAARANEQPQIVIMPAEPLGVPDSVAHVIFNVTDANATVAAVKAAGGTVTREPSEFGNSGIVIAFVADPAGNLIELIQPAQRRQ